MFSYLNFLLTKANNHHISPLKLIQKNNIALVRLSTLTNYGVLAVVVSGYPRYRKKRPSANWKLIVDEDESSETLAKVEDELGKFV